MNAYEAGFVYLDYYLEQREVLRHQLLDDKKSVRGQIEVADGGRNGGIIECRFIVGPEVSDQYTKNVYRQTRHLFMEDMKNQPNHVPYARLLMTELVDNYGEGTLTYSFHLTHLLPSGQIESFYDYKVVANKDREMIEHGTFGPFIDVNYQDVVVYDYSGADLMFPDISESMALDDYFENITAWRSELQKTLAQARVITARHLSE